MNEPIQLVFPFAPDPNYCPFCKSYDRRSPKCLFPHKLSNEVLFPTCGNCKGGIDENDLICSKCLGRGYIVIIKKKG